MAMRCKECGARLGESQSRCPYCGTWNRLGGRKPKWGKAREQDRDEFDLSRQVPRQEDTQENLEDTAEIGQDEMLAGDLGKDELTWLHRSIVKCLFNSLIVASLVGIMAAVAGLLWMESDTGGADVDVQEGFSHIQQLYQQGQERELSKVLREYSGEDWESPFYGAYRIYEFHQQVESGAMDFFDRDIEYNEYEAERLLWDLRNMLRDAQIYYNDPSNPVVNTMCSDYMDDAAVFAASILGFGQEWIDGMKDASLSSEEQEKMVQAILDRRLQYE